MNYSETYKKISGIKLDEQTIRDLSEVYSLMMKESALQPDQVTNAYCFTTHMLKYLQMKRDERARGVTGQIESLEALP